MIERIGRMPSLYNALGRTRPHLFSVIAQNVPPESNHEETIRYAQMEGHSTRQLGCLKNVNVMKETKGSVGGTVGIIHSRSDSEGVNQPNEVSNPDGVLDFFF